MLRFSLCLSYIELGLGLGPALRMEFDGRRGQWRTVLLNGVKVAEFHEVTKTSRHALLTRTMDGGKKCASQVKLVPGTSGVFCC